MQDEHLKEIESNIQKIFSNMSLSHVDRLNQALRYLAKYRSLQIGNTLLKLNGTEVLGGPFKGMNFLNSVSEGCYVPKLLGNYESELHDYISRIIKSKPDIIINVGSAEGYYSVGMKMLLPKTEVYAFDIDKNAQEKCKELSAINGVSINVEGEFQSHMLEDFRDKKIFFMCDIEGDEINLINAENIHLYKNCEVCIELHYSNRTHNKDKIPSIFEKTHDVELIWQKGKNFDVPETIYNISHLDILLSGWEFRSYPTPWLVGKPLQK